MSSIIKPSSGGSGSGITLQGNVGGALGPSTSFDIFSDNTNIGFRGTLTTLTLDFGYDINQDAVTTNLLLGVMGASITSGIGNTNVGIAAMQSVSSGISNSSFGHASLNTLSTGSFNTAIGEGTMFSCGSAILGNSALGWHCLITCAGNYNIGIGYNVMGMGITGDNNIGIGYFALENLKTGSENICIGKQAGFQYSGAETNNICIGNEGVVGDNNCVRIGNALSDYCEIVGIAQQELVAGAAVVSIDTSTNQLGISNGSPQVVLASAQFSALSTGDYVIATVNKDFVVENVILRTVTEVGAAGDSNCSLGYNSPTFDNIFASALNFTNSNNGFTDSGFPSTSPSTTPLVPAGQTITLSVNTADSTATTLDVKVYITGFYA